MTNQPPQQTVVVRFIADTQDAITRARNFRQEVELIKERMMVAAAQSGQSFKDLAVAMQQAAKVRFDEATNSLRNQGPPVEELRAGLARLQAQYQQTKTAISTGQGELTKETSSLTGGFGVLGQAIGTALGLGTVQIINKLIGSVRQLIDELAQAAEQGYQFAKAMFQIEIGVNALRRAGTDITFKEVITQLDMLKTKFGIFSKTELAQGAAAFLNLNRNMGFTRDELFELQEAVATLAVVNGRSMEEVQRTVALALSSGYTEGLQRLGVSINRVTIAEEAAALGYADSYMALTELERAEATRIQILEKTAVYADDVLTYQEKLPGQIDTITASIVDLNTATGQLLIPIKALGVEIKLIRAEFKRWAVENSVIVAILVNLQGEIQNFKDSGRNLGQYIWDNFTQPFKDASKEAETFWGWLKMFTVNALKGVKTTTPYEQYRAELNEPTVPEAPVAGAPAAELNQDQIKAVEDTAERILELQFDYANDMRDLEIDLQRDLAEIEAEGQAKLEELAAKHAQKMLDIANDGKLKLDQLQADYDLDVKKVWDSYYNNIETANQKHANKLLKIEEDYQERLQKLKEGFLLDLEDALHERDARQILTLIKRYNVEREQSKRERDQNKREEERAYQEQLDELRRQRDLRLKELHEEFLKRYAELYNQMVRELKLEEESYQHKKIQQEAENKKDRDDRLLKYQQDLEDLRLHLDDRLRELAVKLAEEVNITGQAMSDVLKILSDTLGPGGDAQKVYDYYVQMVMTAMAAAAKASAMYRTFLPLVGNPTTGNHAQGGMEIANKKTTAIFGEAGPELALFVPLKGGSLTASASPTVAKIPELATGGKDKIKIELLLSPGIEARIIDKTLDDVADVILRRMR